MDDNCKIACRYRMIIALCCAFVLIIGIACVGMALVLERPLVICRFDLPDGYIDDIVAQARGMYSERIPIIALCVTVDDYTDGAAYYTIHYFPFGTVGMTYIGDGGFDCTKYLTGLG